jgi:hypothetical protein
MGDNDELSGVKGGVWEAVLELLCRLQSVLPDAVLVGGTASALYAGHRLSFDHDHVLPDLRERFDAVLAQLEAVSGWETARIKRPVRILGSLDGVETGVRRLRRAQPLDTTVMRVGAHDVILPTLPEALRIKAFLCLQRNAARDYLDLAALAAHMGMEAAGEALWSMDELYPQKSGVWVVRTQLIMQLAAPPPYDLDGVDLAQYKGVRPPFDRWEHVADVCGKLSDRLLNVCEKTLRDAPTSADHQAQMEIEQWRDARDTGRAIPPAGLPGIDA